MKILFLITRRTKGVLRFKDKEGLLDGYTAGMVLFAVQDYIQYDDALQHKWNRMTEQSPALSSFQGHF
ncbi:hypothetical protein ACEQPO_27070 [Bacillus sp. SL00103]